MYLMKIPIIREHPVIILYLWFSFVGYLSFTRFAKYSNEKDIIKSKFYPSRYIDTPKWMKKKYEIHNSRIPDYCYISILTAIISPLVGLLFVIITIIIGKHDKNLFHIWFYLFWGLPFIVTFIWRLVFIEKKKK